MPETTLSAALTASTADQPGARVALSAALGAPAHAYLFAGPGGDSMRDAARAFAAELLADGADDPESARARALADPSPHPDLVWIAPPGGQHLVDEIRERLIRAIAYRPFEGGRRVFVIEAAGAMADESQNGLLKTLEEPPPYAHLILLSAESAGLKSTVASRCQRIPFQPLSAEALEERLRTAPEEATPPEVRAAARLAAGDPARAQFLLSEGGRELRAAAVRCSRAATRGELEGAPWLAILEIAEREGAEAEKAALEISRERAEISADERAKTRAKKDGEAAAKRAARRRRTEALDLALSLSAGWFRDLAAAGEGASELALHADRADDLAADAAGVDSRAAIGAAELALDAKRRLRVNVSEELALEALFFRAESLLAST